MEFSHVSVLLKETVDGAFTDPNGVYADLTTGGGGHSLELAKRLDGGRLICFDQDKEALEAAGERLAVRYFLEPFLSPYGPAHIS